MRSLAILILLLFGASTVKAQVKSIGVPFISFHSKRDYRGGTQNWDFVQSENGILHVANNNGVLRYDGLGWELIPMPNGSVVRSLFRDEDERIYVGASNEFGFLEPDSLGRISYHSLKEQIPEFEFEDIWRIVSQGDFLYFQCFDGLIVYNKELNAWKVISSDQVTGFLHQSGERLFFNRRGSGLMEVKGLEVFPVPGGDRLALVEVWLIQKMGNLYLVGTQNNGVFTLSDSGITIWDTPVNNLLLTSKLYSFEYSDENLYWGTIQDGLIVSDQNGEVVTHLNKESGLNNNTILSLFIDRYNSLWLGLDNGINQVLIHSQVSKLLTSNDIGAGYCSAVFQNRVYLGTNQGLFWLPYNPDQSNWDMMPEAIEVVECSGQVWALKVVGDELLVGHTRGTFAVRGDQVRQLYSDYGGWNFHEIPGYPDIILQGTYNGLVFYQSTDKGISLQQRLDGFELSSRKIIVGTGREVWIGHGYEGIFKLRLSENLDSIQSSQSYGSEDGLLTDNFNELLQFSGQIMVSNPQGIFVYDRVSDLFSPATEWNKVFSKGTRLTSLIQGSGGDYFYFQENRGGQLFSFSDTLLLQDNVVFAPLDQSFLPSFENMIELDRDEYLISTDFGFAHLDLKTARKDQQKMPIHFKRFASLRNQSGSGLFLEAQANLGEERSDHPLLNIPYRDNDIRISFVAPTLVNPDNVSYQFLLNGQNSSWSQWTDQTEVDITNLREGDYYFQVRAQTTSGARSEIATLFFRIRSPWYRTVIAYLSYFFLIALGFWLSWKLISLRIQRERRRSKILEERRMLHKQLKLKRAAEQSEKEIVKLRNDKLRSDIRHKSKELANQTMGVLQKNRFLTEIKNEMVRLKKQAQNEEVISFMNKMIRKINRNIEDEDTHRIFETNFDQVHENFIQRLQESFPHLTAKDLRLCAYLRMNLSSKEIAPLLNISTRGVEISRYRLRKKLDLDHNESLADFILKF